MKKQNKLRQRASSVSMTYEQSLEKMQRIKDAISDATRNRNYDEAKILESYLKKHEKVHARLFEQTKAQLLKDRLSELESEKLQRQAELVEEVIIRLNNIYDTYDRNYADLERRHMMNIENLRCRFNKPTFTNIKTSSTIRNLCAAEKYYANVMQDYQTAAQIKKQIEQQSNYEQEEFDRTTGTTIEAKVRDAIHNYKAQQSSFAQRLLTEKNILKRDVKRQILGMENRYKKIIYSISGPSSGERGSTLNPDEKMDITTTFENQIMATIDYEFNEFAKKLQAQYKTSSNIIIRSKAQHKNASGRGTNIRSTRSSSIGPKTKNKYYERKSSISNNSNYNKRESNSPKQVRVFSNIRNRNVRVPQKKSQKNNSKNLKYSLNDTEEITEETLTDTDYDSDNESGNKHNSDDNIKIEDIDFDKIKINDIKDEKEIDIKYMIKRNNLVINSNQSNVTPKRKQTRALKLNADIEKKPIPPSEKNNISRRPRNYRKRISEVSSYEIKYNIETESKKRNPRLDFALKKREKALLQDADEGENAEKIENVEIIEIVDNIDS